ncbi:hypothetical protein [Mucilaginibacter sp. CSA2-8R]|uniref:hypothetical protein n=1 Tax=Mucilaginibacter sp. CSA2-8R TaxID=3141542 RepID=UPI00315D2062
MLFVLLLILSLAASYILPWWTIAIMAFVASLLMANRAAQAFWSGFAALFLAWMVLSLFKSMPNEHQLAERVAQLFGLPHWTLLLLITCVIGGLVGGLSALSGYYIKQVVMPSTVKQ